MGLFNAHWNFPVGQLLTKTIVTDIERVMAFNVMTVAFSYSTWLTPFRVSAPLPYSRLCLDSAVLR